VQVEEALVRAGQVEPCDILKVGHHGSRGASSPGFLARLRPRLAVVSVGQSNPWGHPHPQVLQAVARAGARTFRTDRHGMISLETDGNWIRWSVRTLR
jgi:competence protein ComEC